MRASNSAMIPDRCLRKSSSVSAEASRRTPQQMSKPTPPGDTTPPAATSVAATPPMGKP